MAIIRLSGYDVEIDDEDLEKVSQKKWYIRRYDTKYGLYYFVANGSRKKDEVKTDLVTVAFDYDKFTEDVTNYVKSMDLTKYITNQGT